MDHGSTLTPPKLSQAALDALCEQILEAADHMGDDQILCVADALHDTLRLRRQMRGRVHQRVEERLCAGGSPAFPF